MNFRHKLQRVLAELIESGPRIVSVRFIPARPGQYAAEVTYDDGLVEVLFLFDPGRVSFSQQELVGLTAHEARWLKDKKTDDAIGIEPPA